MERFFLCHNHQDWNGGWCYMRPERTLFSGNFLPTSRGKALAAVHRPGVPERRERPLWGGRTCGRVPLWVGRALTCGPVLWSWPCSAAPQLSPVTPQFCGAGASRTWVPGGRGSGLALGARRNEESTSSLGPGPSGFPVLWTWKCPQLGTGERAQGQGEMGAASGGRLAWCAGSVWETQDGWLPAKVVSYVTISAMPSNPMSLSQFRW